MGWYVETWGGGRYTSIAYFKDKYAAENLVRQIIMKGGWNGMPPRISQAQPFL